MEWTKTACTYDCPDACGLLAAVVDDELRLRGDPDHPVTGSFLCSRIRKHGARLRSAGRLRAPLLREGDRFREVDWPEAMSLAAEKLSTALAESGPASVVLVTGGGSLGISKELIGHFFCSLGPVTTVAGGLCGEAGEAAQHLDFGDAASHDYADLRHSSAVVLWGKNVAATGVHLLPLLKAAQRRGAPVVLIEPRPTETSPHADRCVTVAPGGDGFLALAVLRRLYDSGRLDSRAAARVDRWEAFEGLLSSEELEVGRAAARAGATAEDVDFLADLYAGPGPIASWIGWGLQRRRSGGRNLRCIDALALLAGQVGVKGGGVSFTSTRRRGLDLSSLATPSGRRVRAATLGRDLADLADPPARFVYVAGANPVTQNPDSATTARALRGAGFVVVADAFFTDTAEAADLVLPVRLMLEEDDVVGSYQHHHVAPVRKVVDPPAGVRGDVEILRDLGERIGRAPDPILERPAEALRKIAAPWLGEGPREARRNPHHDPVPFADGFPTASGRASLLSDLPEEVAPGPGYPLSLLSVSARRWQTSQLPEEDQEGPLPCFVHPEAPGVAGRDDGAAALLESPLGSLEVTLRLDARLGPEVAVVHRGGWLRHGRGVNLLVEAAETDLGGGAAFYDQRVRLSGPVK